MGGAAAPSAPVRDEDDDHVFSDDESQHSRNETPLRLNDTNRSQSYEVLSSNDVVDHEAMTSSKEHLPTQQQQPGKLSSQYDFLKIDRSKPPPVPPNKPKPAASTKLPPPLLNEFLMRNMPHQAPKKEERKPQPVNSNKQPPPVPPNKPTKPSVKLAPIGLSEMLMQRMSPQKHAGKPHKSTKNASADQETPAASSREKQPPSS